MSNIKHTRNYLIGSVAVKALGFVSIPFFTHYLSVEEYGMMSLYLTILSFLSTLFSLGVLGSFKRYYFEDKNDFGEFLYSNMIMLFVLDIIIIIFLSCFLNTISDFLKIPENLLIYAMIVSIFLMINKIKLDILQVREKSKDNVVFEFIQSVLILSLAIVFILYLSDNKYLGKVYGDIVGYSIVSIYALYKLSKIMKYKFNFSYIKYSLLFGLPVLPSMFSSFGLAFADRLMINNMTNTTDVGIYSFAFMIAMLIQVVIGAVGKSWQPMFYKALSMNDFSILDKTFILNSKLVLTASLFLILFSYEFIFVLANKNYMNAQIIIIYFVIGFNFFFLYTVFSQYNSYAKKTYIDSIITFIVVLLNIGLNYIFIPIYGYTVSAITTIVSYAIMFLLFYVSSKYILKYKVVNIFSAWKIYLFYIILLIIFLFIKSFEINYFFLLNIKIIIISLFFYYNFKNEFLNYIRDKNV